MKRTPLARKAPLKRGGPLPRTTGVKAVRSKPRRREAPRWTRADWVKANTLLMERSGGVCERCRKPDCGPFERHHRKRRRDGGDRLANLLLLGRPCHVWVTEHPREAREAGWIVPVWGDPLVVPVLVGSRWWLLDDAGNKFCPNDETGT